MKKNYRLLTRNSLRLQVYSAVFTALAAAGAYISFPLAFSPVPIVIYNIFFIMAGLLIGGRWGMVSVGIYLLIGALGVPVFSGGRSGIAHLLGPGGGYLISFLPSVFIIGLISHMGKPTIWKDITASITGTVIIYAIGVPWLKISADMSWQGAVAGGIFPFLIGDGLKIAAAVAVSWKLRPLIRRQIENP
jgi:biotin transport system substrate-specific component